MLLMAGNVILITIMVVKTFQLREKIQALEHETNTLFLTCCNVMAVYVYLFLVFAFFSIGTNHTLYTSSVYTLVAAGLYLVLSVGALWYVIYIHYILTVISRVIRVVKVVLYWQQGDFDTLH